MHAQSDHANVVIQMVRTEDLYHSSQQKLYSYLSTICENAVG